MIEVKAKSINPEKFEKIEKRDGTISNTWKPYISEVAFQKWVLEDAFPEYTVSASLLLLDRNSICPTDGLNQKFLVERGEYGKAKVSITVSAS